MISDITLGQFFPGTSPVHRLDPRTKIILALLFIVGIFLAKNPLSLLVFIIITIVMIPVSGIGFSVILKTLKPIVLILIFTSLMNIFLTKVEGDPLLAFWIVKIYKEGLLRALFMSVRVIVLIIGTSMLLTYTTSPISLTDGIEDLLKPLKYIKVPVHLFAMLMTIALRFIPTLVEETEKIMNAQKSRGADFTSGSLVKRAKALIPLLVPLFVSAFKRAEELATAMECRCYRGDVNRTKLVKLTYRAADILWMLGGALIFAGIILLRILPYNYELTDILHRILFYPI